MPKVFTSKSQKIGEIGENIASRYLENHDFSIIERNYTKPWGEIDIVARKKNKIHIIEVKSQVFNFSFDKLDKEIDRYKPEDNMSQNKISRLRRTIQTYLLERRVNLTWQFDLVIVYLNEETRHARVKLIEDLII